MNARINIRYATALFNTAKEQCIEQAVYEDMLQVVRLYLELPDFKKFLNNPAISALKKSIVLQNVFADQFTPLTVSFFKLIAKKTRTAFVLGIAQMYVNIFREYNGISSVSAYTAKELTDAQKHQISTVLEKKIGKKVVLTCKIAPELIGGIKLLYDNQEYDASIKRKIQTIKQEFSQNLYQTKI
ncbi:MAG: ATP synthase F1 subunit delta [Bacteroidales bacterium]|jgi:F-type H+-transporting ATPase subunit delta|nr:ATP synthase F1 subunit delta [Bacteroidales bacterium]